MNKEDLFDYLRTLDQKQLLTILEQAYDRMTVSQRGEVFWKFEKKFPRKKIGGQALFAAIREFYRDSKAGKFYAPFDINSKNFRHIPEETREWFDLMGDFLKKASQLSEDGEYKIAVDCFSLLSDLIERMERGDEIVFADEYGTWMIPFEGKKWVSAYIQALAQTTDVKGYVQAILPLIKRDSFQSFTLKVYSSAIKHANAEQKKLLKQEIKTKNLKIK